MFHKDSTTVPTAVPKSESDSDKEAKSQSEDGFYYKAKHQEKYSVDQMSMSIECYEKYGAPFWAKSQQGSIKVIKRCFSHKDVVSAVKETLAECVALNVFEKNAEEKECAVPIILVGLTAKHYQPLLENALEWHFEWQFRVPDGISVKKVMSEEVKNQEGDGIEERSSALRRLLQSAVSPHELARFKPIDAIEREIIRIDEQGAPEAVEQTT